MLLKLLFLYFVAVVTSAPQDFDNTLRNEIKNIAEAMKPSLFSREPTSFDIDEDRDGAITNFLTHAMENYHTWLAKEDPLSPDPTEVTLSTTALGDYDLVDLDAILKISNQSMTDHSKLGLETLVYASSEESLSWLNAARGVVDGEDVIFSGMYNVFGSINISSALQIPFNGQGKWTLKGNQITEVGAYNNYTVDENGYIDLSTSPYAPYSYRITWNHIEFEGLQFDYNGEIEETWMPRLLDRLAEFYGLFLRNGLAFEQLSASEYNLPRRLFKAYFQERFQSTKLDDIVSRWQPTTSTDTETTTPVTDNGNNIIGSLWVHILTLGAVFLYN